MMYATRTITLAALFLVLAGCADKIQSCRGVASADSVEAAAPAITAFEDHLSKYSSRSELDQYFGDFRHYDLAITTSESAYDYDFIPQNNGKGYKGGGAHYSVSRETGKIIRTEYMK